MQQKRLIVLPVVSCVNGVSNFLVTNRTNHKVGSALASHNFRPLVHLLLFSHIMKLSDMSLQIEHGVGHKVALFTFDFFILHLVNVNGLKMFPVMICPFEDRIT